MRKLAILLPLFLAACQSGEAAKSQAQEKNSFAEEIHQLDTADADAEVAARTKLNNWRFLACYTDAPPAGTYIPGLSKSEINKYVDSGLFETEIYLDHRTIYVFQFDGDPIPWEEAKWRFAERVNRALVKKIKRSGQPNQPRRYK